MEGGIRAWKGLRASGPPDAGMAYFDPAKKAEELIALGWMLEEGSGKFYGEMEKKEKGPEAIALFRGPGIHRLEIIQNPHISPP